MTSLYFWDLCFLFRWTLWFLHETAAVVAPLILTAYICFMARRLLMRNVEVSTSSLDFCLVQYSTCIPALSDGNDDCSMERLWRGYSGRNANFLCVPDRVDPLMVSDPWPF